MVPNRLFSFPTQEHVLNNKFQVPSPDLWYEQTHNMPGIWKDWYLSESDAAVLFFQQVQ